MTSLFQQKQRELLVAVGRVEELNDQLEALRNNRLEAPFAPPLAHHNTSSTAELEHLYKELQVRSSPFTKNIYFKTDIQKCRRYKNKNMI